MLYRPVKNMSSYNSIGTRSRASMASHPIAAANAFVHMKVQARASGKKQVPTGKLDCCIEEAKLANNVPSSTTSANGRYTHGLVEAITSVKRFSCRSNPLMTSCTPYVLQRSCPAIDSESKSCIPLCSPWSKEVCMSRK
jgi:hypothetical protein